VALAAPGLNHAEEYNPGPDGRKDQPPGNNRKNDMTALPLRSTACGFAPSLGKQIAKPQAVHWDSDDRSLGMILEETIAMSGRRKTRSPQYPRSGDVGESR